ncbi:MAG: lycopene cyclase domain protein [Bacteroidota bacterium]|jgi:lycopene cyclase domain-containing protein|nr:lycopene cyclase domain protein [Bacteroidota bacterium]
MRHLTYVFVLLFTLSYPLYKSFEDKIAYHKKWKSLFPAILISALIFIAWDIWFTKIGIWSFNNEYLLGIYLLNLPIEEWLFFFIIPFSCVFIYEVMNYFMKEDLSPTLIKTITLGMVTGLLLVSAFNLDKFYTAVTFLSLAGFLLLHHFVFQTAYLGRYYIAWAVCIIPFLLVNGVLTAMPVLIYNNLENLNSRIYTIPIEDVFYGMLQFLLVITIYEFFKNRRS